MSLSYDIIVIIETSYFDGVGKSLVVKQYQTNGG